MYNKSKRRIQGQPTIGVHSPMCVLHLGDSHSQASRQNQTQESPRCNSIRNMQLQATAKQYQAESVRYILDHLEILLTNDSSRLLHQLKDVRQRRRFRFAANFPDFGSDLCNSSLQVCNCHIAESSDGKGFECAILLRLSQIDDGNAQLLVAIFVKWFRLQGAIKLV